MGIGNRIAHLGLRANSDIILNVWKNRSIFMLTFPIEDKTHSAFKL